MVEVIDNLDESKIVESKSKVDFGADSSGIVEVVSRSMKDLELRVKRTELSEAKNLSDLISIFERAANSR